MMKWISVETPPKNEHELVEVKDSAGIAGLAFPCWYSFRIINKKVVYCEPYFDGWLVKGNGFDIPEIGTITQWRQLLTTPK